MLDKKFLDLGIYFISIVRRAVSQGQLHIPWLVYLSIALDSVLERKQKDSGRRIEEYGPAGVQNVNVPNKENQFFEKQIEFYTKIFTRVPHLELDALEQPYVLAAKVYDWARTIQFESNQTNIDDILIKPPSMEHGTNKK